MSSALTTLQRARPGDLVPRPPGEGQQLLYFNEYTATPWSQVPAATAPIDPAFALPADPFPPLEEDSFVGAGTAFSLIADAFRHSNGPATRKRSPEHFIIRTMIRNWLAYTGHIQKNPANRTMIRGIKRPMIALLIQQLQRATSNSVVRASTAGVEAGITTSLFTDISLHFQTALLGDAWPAITDYQNAVRSRSEVELHKIKQRVDELGERTHSGATIVDRATIESALKVLDLLPSAMEVPQVSSSPDGEIGLFWFHNMNRVEVYLDAEGHLTWIGKFGDTFDPGGDVEWSGSLPVQLLEMLNRLYE
jgi:hypothetical protein